MLFYVAFPAAFIGFDVGMLWSLSSRYFLLKVIVGYCECFGASNTRRCEWSILGIVRNILYTSSTDKTVTEVSQMINL